MEDAVKHSVQPTRVDAHGVVRFKENPIVSMLLKTHTSMDMNDIARMGFSDDDRQHFAQLIGYSVSGYGTLSYSDEDIYDAKTCYIQPPLVAPEEAGDAAK